MYNKNVSDLIKVKTKIRSKNSSRQALATQEPDNIYILKLVLYLILGALWLRITFDTMTLPLPVGAIIGLFIARTERFGTDRKIEYAVLLISMFVGFWLPIGVELVL